jgi:hypothetical protein
MFWRSRGAGVVRHSFNIRCPPLRSRERVLGQFFRRVGREFRKRGLNLDFRAFDCMGRRVLSVDVTVFRTPMPAIPLLGGPSRMHIRTRASLRAIPQSHTFLGRLHTGPLASFN